MPDSCEYTVRVSPRAKHVRLQISMAGELIVVIPRHFDPANIPPLLEERRAWIEKSLRHIRTLRAELPSSERPTALALLSIQETWALEWDQVDGRQAVTREFPGKRLLIHGDVAVPDLWQPVLRHWVMKQAERTLRPWVERLATAHAFAAPPRISIRCQRTRWGSFSRSGTLSLNAQLLFLRDDLVHYVLLHELCHTVHLDHSPAFWNLLESHEPRARELRRELRDGWRNVPRWLARTSLQAP